MSYSSIVHVHAAAGLVGLAAFWLAAALRKGTRLHRRVGGTYFAAMALVMTTTPVLAGAAFASGQVVSGAFLSYLIVITATALYTAWRAIRDRADPARFFGRTFRALGWVNLASGAAVFALGARFGAPVLFGMSLIGLFVGGEMVRSAGRVPTQRNWWLRRHYGGILGCGIATHVAFLSIGLQRMLPGELAHVASLLAWFAPVAVAVVAKRALDARYGGAAATVPSASPAGG